MYKIKCPRPINSLTSDFIYYGVADFLKRTGISADMISYAEAVMP